MLVAVGVGDYINRNRLHQRLCRPDRMVALMPDIKIRIDRDGFTVTGADDPMEYRFVVPDDDDLDEWGHPPNADVWQAVSAQEFNR